MPNTADLRASMERIRHLLLAGNDSESRLEIKYRELEGFVKEEYRPRFYRLVYFLDDPGNEFWDYCETDGECQKAIREAMKFVGETLLELMNLLRAVYEPPVPPDPLKN